MAQNLKQYFSQGQPGHNTIKRVHIIKSRGHLQFRVGCASRARGIFGNLISVLKIKFSFNTFLVGSDSILFNKLIACLNFLVTFAIKLGYKVILPSHFFPLQSMYVRIVQQVS